MSEARRLKASQGRRRSPQFGLPRPGACSASITRLIRAHNNRPSSSPRSSIKSARFAASSSASAPCFPISKFAARQTVAPALENLDLARRPSPASAASAEPIGSRASALDSSLVAASVPRRSMPPSPHAPDDRFQRIRCAAADWWCFQMGPIECWLDRGAAPKRAASRLRRTPETPRDQAIREGGERIRRAFSWIDFDHPGAAKIRRLKTSPSKMGYRPTSFPRRPIQHGKEWYIVQERRPSSSAAGGWRLAGHPHVTIVIY
jgi:hypothetical protein